MQSHEYARMADIERRHWWFVGKRDLVRRLVAAHCPGHDLTILDAGCGTGQTLVELAGLGRVIGADLQPQAVQQTRRRGVECVVQADCQRPPFADSRFDLVLLLDTLEHVPDDVGALRALGRTLRPGGKLLVSVPAHPGLFGRHDRALGHLRRYTRRGLVQAVHEAGLRLCRLTGYVAWPLVAAFVWRSLTRDRPGGRLRSDVHLALPAWINAAMTRLVCLENRFHRYRALGPSLSIVAVLERPPV